MAFLLAAFGSVALVWIVGSLLVQPTNHPVATPAGFDARVVAIPGAGHEIAGWWIDGGADSPVVLLLHGVRADRSSMVSRALLLRKYGFSALLIDLQAHGETPGTEITFGARESKDVSSSLDWIRRIAPGRRVGVIGCSLGGASVLLVPQPSGFDAVVLEAAYPRLTRAVENRIRMRVGPLAPILTPLLLMQLKPRLNISASDLEPIRYISQLGAPVLIAAGSADEGTTLDESKDLYEAASNPKELWIARGARHQDLQAFDPGEYEQHVVKFLSKYLQLRETLNPPPQSTNKALDLIGLAASNVRVHAVEGQFIHCVAAPQGKR